MLTIQNPNDYMSTQIPTTVSSTKNTKIIRTTSLLGKKKPEADQNYQIAYSSQQEGNVKKPPQTFSINQLHLYQSM